MFLRGSIDEHSALANRVRNEVSHIGFKRAKITGHHCGFAFYNQTREYPFHRSIGYIRERRCPVPQRNLRRFWVGGISNARFAKMMLCPSDCFADRQLAKVGFPISPFFPKQRGSCIVVVDRICIISMLDREKSTQRQIRLTV